MQRKTLTERLTNKYQLIVRSEDNFADRWRLSFNLARLLVVAVVLVMLFYAVVTGLNMLGVYLLGGNNESEENQQLILLASRVDSLEYEVQMKDQYIMAFKTMLEGGEARVPDTSGQNIEKFSEEVKISKEEEEFRKKFEKEVPNPGYRSKEGFANLYFFAPVAGKTTDLLQNGKVVGLYIEARPEKPVRVLEAGVVVSETINPDSTYKLMVQHRSGLLTVYDRLQKPLVKSHTSVDRGTEIAAPAIQKIVFSMMYNGKILNPKEYVAWER
jgi:hypothetical protein